MSTSVALSLPLSVRGSGRCQSLLRYQEKGVVEVLSYNQFLQRLKALGL
ncbi:MAG: hypothetical protein RXQ94_07725 [Caldivirga sp.]